MSRSSVARSGVGALDSSHANMSTSADARDGQKTCIDKVHESIKV